MRVSRPCYDKMHRCPGWAGGGMKFAKVTRCRDGRIVGYTGAGRMWKWRFLRCNKCDVAVLPYVTRYVDPAWIGYKLTTWWRFR